MGVLSLLRKGFGYVLLSMGVSSPDAAKKKPARSLHQSLTSPVARPLARSFMSLAGIPFALDNFGSVCVQEGTTGTLFLPVG